MQTMADALSAALSAGSENCNGTALLFLQHCAAAGATGAVAGSAARTDSAVYPPQKFDINNGTPIVPY